MPSGPIWFEIHVTDLAHAETFYRAVAGWEFGPLDGMPPEYRMIANRDGGTGGALVAGFPDRAGGSGTVVYLEVPDLDAALATVRELGGTVEAGERLINPADGRFAQARDPDGNLIGLWSA
jgi:predicted enzyme related to lactoylglutathione lyase